MTSAITGTGVVSCDRVDGPAVGELLRGERVRALAAEAKLLLAAARLALRDAGLEDGAIDPDELGIAVATSHAGEREYLALLAAGRDPRAARVSPALAPQAGLNGPASVASIRLGAAGPNATVCGGAAGGLDALRYAADALAHGRARAMLVCGVDAEPASARAPGAVARADALAPATPASGGAAPARAGGAAVLVLEAPDAARAQALVAGVATACSPRGDAADAGARARRAALREAGVRVAVAIEQQAAGEPEAMAAVAQLARAAGYLRRRAARGPLVVCATGADGGAGAAVLVAAQGGAA
jgi:3-oxoacyl-[acyl-carrier-protein] synthase II